MKKLHFLSPKMAKRLTLAAVIATATMFASSTTASAVDIGASFEPTTDTNPYTGLGVLGETFTAFDGPAGGGNATITQLLGQGVTLSLAPTEDADGFYFSDEAGSATNLFGSFAAGYDPAGLAFTYTLSGLTAGATYNIALYAEDLGGRSGDNATTFTVNSTNYSVGPANGGGAFEQQSPTGTFSPGNTQVVRGITANSSGDIVVTSTGPGGYQEINGISVESAPEPGTWALLLGGVGALFGLQTLRRRVS